MLASSPEINDELGSEEQFSNERNAGWDAAAWNETEELSNNSRLLVESKREFSVVMNELLF